MPGFPYSLPALSRSLQVQREETGSTYLGSHPSSSEIIFCIKYYYFLFRITFILVFRGFKEMFPFFSIKNQTNELQLFFVFFCLKYYCFFKKLY